MGWNYGIPVPSSGRPFELHRRSRPIDALRQLPPALATRCHLVEEPPAHATGRGRLP